MKELTPKDVRDSGMKVWKYLWEHPECEHKDGLPFFNEIEDFDNECAACELSQGDCSNCLIVDNMDSCTGVKSLYTLWEKADNPTDRAFYAKKIYEAHEAINVEEPVVIQVGDYAYEEGDVWGEVIGIDPTKDDDESKYFVSNINDGSIMGWKKDAFDSFSRPDKPKETVFENVTVVCHVGRIGEQAKYIPTDKEYSGKWDGQMLKQFHGKNKKYDIVVRERPNKK